MVVTHGSFRQESNSSQPLSHDGGFFNRLEDDVHKILVREKRREQLTEHNGTDNCPAPEHNQACKYHSLKSTVSSLFILREVNHSLSSNCLRTVLGY